MIRINRLLDDPTVAYAAEELAKYLSQMLGGRETAREKYELFKTEMSKREPRLERYPDHWLSVAYPERPIRTEDKFW